MKALRVLIVDDNEATRLILGDMIASFGHAIVSAADGLESALACYRAHKPDLVTLDLSLPGHDGLTILKALRAEDPAAKVLIISGNSQQRIFDALMAAGAWGYMTKPVDPDRLEDDLRRLAAS